jgi:hypothetical protein
MIKNSDILKFQKLYLKYFGKQIDKESSRAKLSVLLSQIEAIYQPITDQQLSNVDGNEHNEPVRPTSYS